MFDDILTANRAYASRFDAGNLPAPPARGLAVVTCMDVRIDPLRALGLRLGDAHVVRNAGGRVSDDVLRSLTVSSHALGVEQVMVIHHTRCGMATSEEALRRVVTEATGVDVSDLAFLTIGDPDTALSGDVERLLACDHLPALTVGGYRYDVDTGELAEVVPPRTR